MTYDKRAPIDFEDGQAVRVVPAEEGRWPRLDNGLTSEKKAPEIKAIEGDSRSDPGFNPPPRQRFELVVEPEEHRSQILDTATNFAEAALESFDMALRTLGIVDRAMRRKLDPIAHQLREARDAIKEKE